jgi:serine/threonine-protein kinase
MAMSNSPGRAAVDVGSVIADTYKIEALLGRGGMGAVFLASHRRLAGKQVAIKILHTEIEDTDIVARFKREAEIAAKLNHPNIVGVIDYNVSPDGTPYLVLDYLEGETLAQRIARGPLPLDQVVSIVRQVGSGLAAAHRAGIVHRDLKPQNIFLVPTEVDGRLVEIAKVLDFGISKIRGSQTVKTQDSALLGTPQYMAPEQATGQHANVDERTDIFAFGAIVYEMLSGEPAFGGASIPEVVFKVVYEQPAALDEKAPTAPPAVVAAVAQAMAKPSDQRFPTVTAFVEAVTGQPLSLSRGPFPAPSAGADSPSGARRGVVTGEAFANTMGSGNHGDSPIAATAAAPLSGAGIGAGTGAGSRAGARPIAPAAGTAPGSPGSALAMPQVAPTVAVHDRRAPKKRTGAILAIAIGAAAVIGGATFFVVRGRGPASEPPAQRGEPPHVAAGEHGAGEPAHPAPPTTEPRTPPTPTPPAQPPVDQPTAERKLSETTPPNDPAGDHGDNRPLVPDPKPQPITSRPAGKGRDHGAKPAHPAPPSAPDAGDGDGDDDVRDKLKQAAAALDARSYDTAERLANTVINASAAGPRQRASARLIHGTVQCAARNDQEAAQIDLRNLDGFRAMRTRLFQVCRGHGIVLAQ